MNNALTRSVVALGACVAFVATSTVSVAAPAQRAQRDAQADYLQYEHDHLGTFGERYKNVLFPTTLMGLGVGTEVAAFVYGGATLVTGGLIVVGGAVSIGGWMLLNHFMPTDPSCRR